MTAARVIAASPDEVFAAFTDRSRLETWWGPAGFTSAFTEFAFEVGGRWSFTMHGPDGRDYANEIVVTDFDRPTQIVLDHTSGPRYTLTVTLQATESGKTLVGWQQAFADPDVGRRMVLTLIEANDQLLERLAADGERRRAH